MKKMQQKSKRIQIYMIEHKVGGEMGGGGG
jgi:hypothetical protein